ncbi:MAG TPA: tryptophan synthase subunit beta [Candidatus Acidoferrales bacterium]|nr:tryptophan synthase subunit beta [Candidatus Acidoferrales bacterium]
MENVKEKIDEYYKLPDKKGHFGTYGGSFVPETIVKAAQELDEAFESVKNDKDFNKEFEDLLKSFAGRPTPIFYTKNLSRKYGAKFYLKREDLLHTGAHKINNTIGQALLAERLGKKRIIAETGAGQHGVATATVCALLGLKCIVYMGEEDMHRQEPNVFKMRLLGAEVVPVLSGTKTLKEATSEAIRDWVTNVRDTFYIIGSVVGMHPYPKLVRHFQAVIGRESKKQFKENYGKLPDYVVACVGGGSNSLGIFYDFVREIPHVKLIGVEAAGEGLDTGKTAASLSLGKPGVLHGAMQYLLQDENGNVLNAYSISAGLDYPGVGPEHSYLKDSGLVKYVSVTDTEALDVFVELSRLEGIIPALESAHAVAYAEKLAAGEGQGKDILINLSGRGDKDLYSVAKRLNLV